MATRTRITEKNPATGALPAEQTAENAKKGSGSNQPQLVDKALYQLVENNVGYATQQFSDNLKFNSETLTNVLYDNIYDLIGEKMSEDEFVDWLADELVSRGAVVDSSTDKPVESIDSDQKRELETQLDAVVKLILANRPTFKQHLIDVDAGVKSLKEKLGQSISHMSTSVSILQQRNQTITRLVDKLNSNQQKVDAHVQSSSDMRTAMDSRFSEFRDSVDSRAKQQSKIGGVKAISNSIKGTLGRISSNEKQFQGGFKVGGTDLGNLKKKGVFAKAFGSSGKKGTAGGMLLPKGLPGIRKHAKPPLMTRMKIGMKNLGRKIKDKVSKSFIGKTYRAVKKAVKMVGAVVKGVYKATKATIKGFIKAAKVAGKIGVFAGKMAWGFVKGVWNAGKRVIKTGIDLWKRLPGKAKVLAIFLAPLAIFKSDWVPGHFVVQMGWKAVKFIGKQIWKGIKKLVFKTVSFFKGLFRMSGKFVNKIGNWVSKIGHGIKDKAYRFLVKPIAGMMVSVFGFVSGVVMSPVKFMQQLIPSIFDRTHSAMYNVKEGIKGAWKKTWGFVKRILFNPITLTILIGGLFFIFGKWMFDKLTVGVTSIKDAIFGKITSIAKSIWGFLKDVWQMVSTIGKFLFDAIAWLTDPKGWVVRSVSWVIKAFLWIKDLIKKMMKATGKSDIDIFCMFLAGDYLGIAIHMIAGAIIKIWNWLKNNKLFKIVFGLVKGIIGIQVMIWRIPLTLAESLMGAIWEVGKWAATFGKKGSLKKAAENFTRPWKEWWKNISDIFSGAKDDYEYANTPRQYLSVDPTEENEKKSTRAKIAVRSLKMDGSSSDTMKMLEDLASVEGYGASGQLLARIQNMNKLYQANSEQVGAYNQFLVKAWDMGKGSDDMAAQLLKLMVESPDLSQKLLSAFFYFNPQTGKTMMLRPSSYIGKFLDNIRNMIMDDGINPSQAFKTFIEAFDQLNKERSHIINNQGDVIADFAERIKKFDKNNKDASKNGLNELRDYVYKFNKGDLFDKVTAQSSFNQMKHNDAKTQNIESVTGSSLGTNRLLQVPPGQGNAQELNSDFEMKEEPPPKPEQIGNLLVPPGMNPPLPKNVTADAENDALHQEWVKNQIMRADLANQGISETELNKAGYAGMTFDEFKMKHDKLHPKPEAQLQAEKDAKEMDQAKRMASLRLAKNIQAYHNQGKTASVDGFTVGAKPNILQVPADGLHQRMLMFGPSWLQVQGASKISDDELLLEIDATDSEARERIRKAKKAEEEKKAAEERKKRREQEILDYSAKVEGGFIEVKIGEDVQAMEAAWLAHQNKRADLANEGVSETKLEEMGFRAYTWDEWKRYYRKMHGLPEDGIKRIPFEGKKKERQIDWNTRMALSAEEMQKYGIQVSEDGPVMVPLDKAMAAAADLFKGAKTIHSIRDGLEVMKEGLVHETSVLKQRREKGIPVAAVNIPSDEGEQTNPIPPAPAPDQGS